MTKYTSGPWKVITFDRRGKEKSVNTNCFYFVCNDDGAPIESPSKNQANANLIAAAPEMFAALEMALIGIAAGYETDEDRKGLAGIVARAIKKAKGEL